MAVVIYITLLGTTVFLRWRSRDQDLGRAAVSHMAQTGSLLRE
ncbi:MAG: hypothetical protein ACRETR_10455 [Steroidobacteraceae bacterium]